MVITRLETIVKKVIIIIIVTIVIRLYNSKSSIIKVEISNRLS